MVDILNAIDENISLFLIKDIKEKPKDSPWI